MRPFNFIKKVFKKIKSHRSAEYHKRMLNLILFNSIGMMWCSYVLAWFGRMEIAESLSETIATVIVGVTIPYFITKTIENISKYGSRINRTAKEQEENYGLNEEILNVEDGIGNDI